VVYDKRGKDRGAGGFLRLRRGLRAFRPDLTFCLHRSFRSALLARLIGGKLYGFASAAGAFLYDVKVPRPNGAFEAEKNQKVLEAWAGEAAARQPVIPRLSVSEADEKEGAALVEGIGAFAVIAPSSVWATKRWPAESFARVAEQLWEKRKLRTVVVGGGEAADLGCAARLCTAFAAGDAPAPVNLAGKTGLGALKSVLSRAKLVIANDSAPLHVAIAMGVPVVGVFGPTVRELGFFPNAPAGMAASAELAGLECRPCGLHGHDECPLGHFRCMLDLTPEAVLREVDKVL
jgi:heptosyltransferase-2